MIVVEPKKEIIKHLVQDLCLTRTQRTSEPTDARSSENATVENKDGYARGKGSLCLK